MRINLFRTPGFKIENLNLLNQFLKEHSGYFNFNIIEEPITISGNIRQRVMNQSNFENKSLPNIAPIHPPRSEGNTAAQSVSQFDRRITRKWFEHPIIPPTPMHSEPSIDRQFRVVDQYTSTLKFIEKCDELREKHQIERDDFVIILTDLNNELNWFYNMDPSFENNAFIHTDHWKYFGFSNSSFPIAYLIATIPLVKQVFPDYITWYNQLSKTPKGCPLDRCDHKKDIFWKLRTADFSPYLLNLLVAKQIPAAAINHAEDIMEAVRPNVKAKHRSDSIQQPQELTIKGDNKDIYIDNQLIKLNPRQKAVYQLFLNYPDGLTRVEFTERKEEIISLYRESTKSFDEDAINKTVKNLTSLRNGEFSVVISRINTALKNSLGKTQALRFSIKGPNGGKKKIIFAAKQSGNRLGDQDDPPFGIQR